MTLEECYELDKSAKDLEKKQSRSLEPYALKPDERRAKLRFNFREACTKSPLEYRTGYHRDRDRIIWSKALKRLQNKTQVFPHYVEDHYKRRLTHSLEVAQIATTVARALGLNEVATEAMALGHDLGHTPFGHAGEEALNKILTGASKILNQNINKEIIKLKKRYTSRAIPIFGFDHCAHAIEVVSRIEKEYNHETKHGGLNLTLDVRDGILKHMCERTGKKEKRNRPFSNFTALNKFTKYKDFGVNKGSLEAQCVYFADKVTYLLGDIEDGIRSDILKEEKLKKHDFFTKLKKLYKKRRRNKFITPVKDSFESFRSQTLTILILDCIKNAENKLKSKNFKDVDDVLNCKERIVFVSDSLNVSWKEFYKEWMEDFLFNNERVQSCSFKSEKVITELFEAYWRNEKLIKGKFREHCSRAYNFIKNKDLLKLITVRNYIAGMTDAFATDQHARLYLSSERIRF